MALPTLTCRELDALLSAYLEGELAKAARLAFEQHLRVCAPCVAYLASYRETMRLGRRACDPEVDAADAPRELVEAILALHRARG